MIYFQVSSDIIARCKARISLDAIFTGQVEKSGEFLTECISCCRAWKDTYDRISGAHSRVSEGWVLDESSIFAQVVFLWMIISFDYIY